MKKPLRALLSGALFLAGFLLARLGLQLAAVFFRWINEPSSSSGWVIATSSLEFGLCVLAGVLSIRLGGRPSASAVGGAIRSAREAIAVRPVLRWGLRLVTLAYLATWIFGAPRVQSELERLAVERYKALERRSHAEEWQAFPYIRTSLALPILPGVILSYHEYQLASLAGWGGWTLYAWYPGYTHRIAARMTWIS